jgi:hypothetical protein
VSNPDEGEYAVDAAEYIKTTAEIVTWLVPPPALPPERESIPTAWIDAEGCGYTNGMQEATEAVGTTREEELHSAEAHQHQDNKEYTATSSNGCVITYSKVENNERTTAGDDSRKLDVGGTTSAAASDATDGGATEVTADDEFTVHSGTDEGVQNYDVATGATDDEEGASPRGMFSTKADGQSTRSESCTAVCSSFLTKISGWTDIDMGCTAVRSQGSYTDVVPVLLDGTEIMTEVKWSERSTRYRTLCLMNCNDVTPIGMRRSG